MRPFGCKVYVKNLSYVKKFDPRGIESIFFGYPDNSGGYLAYIPFEDRITFSREVRFIEENDKPSIPRTLQVDTSTHLTSPLTTSTSSTTTSQFTRLVNPITVIKEEVVRLTIETKGFPPLMSLVFGYLNCSCNTPPQ
jgi:hypothetical protein